MTSPAQRGRDPQPMSRGGEVALVALASAALLLVLAALVGLGVAAALFGGGWVWPAGNDTIAAVAGELLQGHPGAGLPAAAAARVPSRAVVYGVIAVVEVLTAALTALAGLLFWRYHLPGDARRGMATRDEAAQVLGTTRLYAARKVLRPDLHGGSGPGAEPAPSSQGGTRCTAPSELGWRLGKSLIPRGVELWVRYDRTTGVYGAQGSGKTLDLLAPALLAHPGAALATLTKLDDLLLTLTDRQAPLEPGAAGARGEPRPVAVLDPFGMAPGVPELVWDPIAGCVDPAVAERRAKAFSAGTVTGAVTGGRQDGAARFYAAETAKVLQGFFHAAALTGRTLEHVLEWVANPSAALEPAEILLRHPHAARFWDGLLSGALTGSSDTVGNTVTTVQQAMQLFFQPAIRSRCVPSFGRPATSIADVLAQHGTVYLLGRDDPYASASPLMTAVAEHVLDTVLAMASASAHGKLTPSFLACLDELPSTTPLPTLRTRMANERALGLSFMYAAQTWRQMVVCYGEDEARSLFGLTNNIVVFGGGKDIHFYREVSDLLGTTRISRQSISDGPGGIGTNRSVEDVPVLRPEHIRLIPERQALVVAENAPPILAKLRRCVNGRDGKALLERQAAARSQVSLDRDTQVDPAERAAAALAYAHAHDLTAIDLNSPGGDSGAATELVDAPAVLDPAAASTPARPDTAARNEPQHNPTGSTRTYPKEWSW